MDEAACEPEERERVRSVSSPSGAFESIQDAQQGRKRYTARRMKFQGAHKLAQILYMLATKSTRWITFNALFVALEGC